MTGFQLQYYTSLMIEEYMARCRAVTGLRGPLSSSLVKMRYIGLQNE